MGEFMRFEVKDHIGVLTLDNPPMNLLPPPAFDEMESILRAAGKDPQVRALILTGAGEVFSAGGDLREQYKRTPDQHFPRVSLAIRALDALYNLPVPTIAAANGHAIGGGMVLIATCDMIVAAEDALIAYPEIDRGLIGGGMHLRRLVPERLARRMALTGEKLAAKELAPYGQLEAVPADRVMPRAMELARTVAGKSPLLTRIMKEALNRTEFMDLFSGYLIEVDLCLRARMAKDGSEAKLAFLEKRSPKYEGK